MAKQLTVALLVVMSAVSATSYSNCPEKCNCTTAVVDCTGSGLTDIPEVFTFKNAEWLKSVTTVNLMLNDISRMDEGAFAGLVNLETLILEQNRLVRITPGTFRPLKSLKYLDLGFNRIEDFMAMTFDGLDNLEVLKLCGNRIEYLTADRFLRVKNLQVLDISANPGIEDLDFILLYGLKKLKSFNMNHLPNVNHLANNFFTESTAIEELHMLNNSMTEFPTIALNPLRKTLKSLHIGFNKIRVLGPSTLVNFENLELLEIYHMVYLSSIAPGAFVNLPHIQKLFIWNCTALEYIDVGAFKQMMNWERHFMQEVSLRYNSLQTLSRSLLPWDHLETVDVQGNKWQCDCDLSWMPHVLRDKLPTSYRGNVLCWEPRKYRGAQLLDLQDDQLTCKKPYVRFLSAHATLMSVFLVVLVTAVLAVVVVYVMYRTKFFSYLKVKYQPLYLRSYNMEVKRDRNREMFAELKPYRDTTRDLEATEPVNV